MCCVIVFDWFVDLSRGCEVGFQFGQNVLIYIGKGRVDFGKVGFDQIVECFKVVFVNGDFDMCFIFVVVVVKCVLDVDDCFDIWQQVFFGQVVVNDFVDYWCLVKIVVNDDFIVRFVCFIVDYVQIDVMCFGYGVVIWCVGDCDFEFVWQELEFRVVG